MGPMSSGKSNPLKRTAVSTSPGSTKKAKSLKNKEPHEGIRKIIKPVGNKTNVAGASKLVPPPPIPLGNSFELLDDNDNEVDMSSMKDNRRGSGRVKNNPIVIVDSNPTLVQQAMNEILPGKKFQLKIMSVGIRVDIHDSENYVNAKDELLKRNFKYYLYHTSQTRPIKICLYGYLEETEEAMQGILSNIDVKPEKIRKLNIKKPLFDRQCIYLLYLQPNTVKLADLQKIKHVNQLRVHWERYTPKSYDKVPQCKNCQRFNHSSELCHLPAKCMVCAADHHTKDCPRKIPRIILPTVK